MRPAIVSTLYEGNIQKALVIFNTALLCIFFNSLES